MPTTTLETFTDMNFATEVLRSEIPVLVDFAAAWCPPCHVIAPILERVAADYAGKLRVGTTDVDANAATANRYEVQHLPTLLVFRNGQVVAQIVGAVPRTTLDSVLGQVL